MTVSIKRVDGDGWDQSGCSRGDKKQVDSGHALKVEPVGFLGRLDV